jgi:exosortase A-associated hydrolase 2
MSCVDSGTLAQPFFLKVGAGQRFCLYHPAPPGTRPAGTLIYVHPFAEELNRSRRMAALQSRALAEAGLAVLQIDLSGCGDSSGDFSDASWAGWNEDLAAAWDWLQARAPGPIGLWGLRLGALLALSFAHASIRPLDRLVLWQPVISGESFLTQFLRMRLASDMLLGLSDQPTGTKEMREALARGETLEVAGYTLTPSLAASVDAMKLADLVMTGMPVHWFEVVAESAQQLPPAAARVVDAWISKGVDLHTRVVPGEKFWMSPEVAECPALLSATTAMFT